MDAAGPADQERVPAAAGGGHTQRVPHPTAHRLQGDPGGHAGQRLRQPD